MRALSLHPRPLGLAAAFALLMLQATPGVAIVTRYIAFGDSITRGTGDSPGGGGYPKRLDNDLNANGVEARVFNFGEGGEKTPEGLTRIDSVLDSVSARVLILMEGTNDITNEISNETSIFNLDQMAKKGIAKNKSVIHSTVIPRYPLAKGDRDNITTGRLNGMIRNLAGTTGRMLADPFEAFWRTPRIYELLYADLDPDPVGHPSAAGHDLLSETFLNVILGIDEMPPLPGLIKPRNRAEGISPAATIDLDIWDLGAGVRKLTATLLVDGEEVPVTTDFSPGRFSFSHSPSSAMSGVVRVSLRAEDLNDPPNLIEREVFRFAIAGTVFFDGDINRDGRVDGLDLAIFALAFGSSRGERRFDVRADLNGNDVVDGIDLAILAVNFGLSSL